MKVHGKKVYADVLVAATDVFLKSQSYRDSARKGGLAMLAVCALPSWAALTTGFTNLTTLAQLAVGLLITLGMLGGLGFVLGACVNLYKKYDRGQEDITWSKVGMQFFAGGLGMALAFVGLQIVETLGGSASDIGRSIGR